MLSNRQFSLGSAAAALQPRCERFYNQRHPLLVFSPAAVVAAAFKGAIHTHIGPSIIKKLYSETYTIQCRMKNALVFGRTKSCRAPAGNEK